MPCHPARQHATAGNEHDREALSPATYRLSETPGSLFWQKARKVDKNVGRVKIPWDQKAFEDDLAEYGKRGIRHITTFAAMIDDKYEAQHGPPPLKEYGLGLKKWRPS